MSRWALGLWNCREVEAGLLTGESLFDGTIAWARIVKLAGVDAVDYHVGASPDRLLPRIHARVVDGRVLGHPPGNLRRQPARLAAGRDVGGALAAAGRFARGGGSADPGATRLRSLMRPLP